MWRPVEDDREVRGNAIMRMRVGFNMEVTAFDIVNYGPFYTEEGVGKEQRANIRKVHDTLSRYFMGSVLPETRRGNASHPGHLHTINDDELTSRACFTLAVNSIIWVPTTG